MEYYNNSKKGSFSAEQRVFYAKLDDKTETKIRENKVRFPDSEYEHVYYILRNENYYVPSVKIAVILKEFDAINVIYERCKLRWWENKYKELGYNLVDHFEYETISYCFDGCIYRIKDPEDKKIKFIYIKQFKNGDLTDTSIYSDKVYYFIRTAIAYDKQATTKFPDNFKNKAFWIDTYQDVYKKARFISTFGGLFFD